MLVAGIMSGTSADGIDVALCRISPARPRPRIELVRHRAFPYPAVLRKAVLAAMDAPKTSAAELARLNWRLGEAYGDAVQAAAQGYALDLVGCHGQTIYHQGIAKPYAGRSIACTWQFGEPALIAAAAHAPVVSNFRPADMVAGGQGAPLVPCSMPPSSHTRAARACSRTSAASPTSPLFPPAADLIRSDRLRHRPRQIWSSTHSASVSSANPTTAVGRLAAAGTPSEPVLTTLLRDPYYRLRPPKSAGREQYGTSFVERLLTLARQRRFRRTTFSPRQQPLPPAASRSPGVCFLLHTLPMSKSTTLLPVVARAIKR